ncbi:MAG: hypothetical protein ACRC9R_06480 [Enterovibrio sp.]
MTLKKGKTNNQRLNAMIIGIFIAMKKVLALALPLILSAQVLANEGVMTKDKSGHTVHIGISKLSGDISSALADSSGNLIFNESDNTIYSFGYDYTTKSGVIFGGYYIPELRSESRAEAYSAPVTAVLWGASLESKVLGLYSGYQFDNNLRFTAGLSATRSETSGYKYMTAFPLSSYQHKQQKTKIGFMLGLDYLVAEKFLVGARISTHEIEFDGINSDGAIIGVNLGYKF